MVHYSRDRARFDEIMVLYRATDVMVVTPVRDGMNLIAKEYVATPDAAAPVSARRPSPGLVVPGGDPLGVRGGPRAASHPGQAVALVRAGR